MGDEQRTASFSTRLVEAATECRDTAEPARRRLRSMRAKAKPALSRFCEVLFLCQAEPQLPCNRLERSRKLEVIQVGTERINTDPSRLVGSDLPAWHRFWPDCGQTFSPNAKTTVTDSRKSPELSAQNRSLTNLSRFGRYARIRRRFIGISPM